MNTRQIKKRAKLALCGKYWWALLAGLILCFISSGFVFEGFLPNLFRGGQKNYDGTIQFLKEFIDSKLSTLPVGDKIPVVTVVLVIIAIVILLVLFVVAVAIFLSLIKSSVEVGYRKFNLSLISDDDRPTLDNLFSYVRPYMWRCLWLDILRCLKVLLWFLPAVGFGYGAYFFWFKKPLSFIYQDYDVMYASIICLCGVGIFTILSIVASMRYSQAGYILAEDPDTKAMEAIERSIEIMDGNKWKLAWLYISFLFWYIICILTGGIGFFFLVPFIDASRAAFYLDKTDNLEMTVDSNIEA